MARVLVTAMCAVLAMAALHGAIAQEFPPVVLQNAVAEFDTVVEELSEPHPEADGYLAMVLVCARVAGWDDLDFDRIAAVSGASALFAYDPETWRSKYANRHIGMDERIAEATGFGFRWVPINTAEDAWEILKKSIDSGRPVMAEHAEMLVFAGYQDARAAKARKVLALTWISGKRQWWTWEQFEKWKTDWAWVQNAVARHSERVEQPPDREVALRVMRDLVEWSVDPPARVVEMSPKAVFGLAGIEAYADDIADTENRPREYFHESWRGGHAICPLCTLRSSTAAYLERLSGTDTFPDEVNQHVLRAGDEYASAYAAWQAYFEHLRWPRDRDQAWETADLRAAGAAAVETALAHERAGLEEIKLALEAAE